MFKNIRSKYQSLNFAFGYQNFHMSQRFAKMSPDLRHKCNIINLFDFCYLVNQ